MSEFAFEVALCAQLERERAQIIARQLGASVHGRRIMDIVCVQPGPEFDARASITPHEIPDAAIESSAGVGQAKYYRNCFDMHPERARSVAERAIDIGFFERVRRGSRLYVRQTARYPDDWFGKVVGIENKPDLSVPGDLELQLRKDVSLGVFDEVILATESYVTRAHLNRIPAEVGVWRFRPETGGLEVVREPTPLDPSASGVDIVDEFAGRTDMRVATPEEKARLRRRMAERAYGKGWRSFDLPACVHGATTVVAGADGIPYCEWKDAIVNPAEACGPACPGYEPADPPAVDITAIRDGRTPWVANPSGPRKQSGLDRFL
ncbi:MULTISPECIES: DUF5787 family protein [unclassified Haladaptatus]|uniref:DUF5787 family protein n=1 Tax=unclassified Haladaptatus TaxID=2622732 RepID=UPI0023E847A6|nr:MULTISPECIES: DUF5787 family protein [unclassified Haladaptatus]